MFISIWQITLVSCMSVFLVSISGELRSMAFPHPQQRILCWDQTVTFSLECFLCHNTQVSP